jgi:hypothetical protein
VVAIFTGHYHLKGHIYKLELAISPICVRYLEKEESATRILCDCEAMAYLLFRHMGHYFMELGKHHAAPIRNVLCIVRSIGLTEG